MWLEKFALPSINKKIAEEINCCRTCYNEINKVEDTLYNKTKKKKDYINVAFEILAGLFDLDYNVKLKYVKDNFDNDSIYIDNINDDFDEMFYKLYLECFKKYLDKIYSFNHIRLENNVFMISRLACLNDDKEVIKKFANNVYLDLLNNDVDLNSDLKIEKITNEDIKRLAEKENKRIINIRKNINSLGVYDRLSHLGIRELFACFSDHIFNKLSDKEKVHVCVLLHNYFTINNKSDNTKRYAKNINKDSSNEDCIRMVINDLLITGRTMIVKKKNIDLINDVLSGVNTIYKNEINIENIGKLDGLNNIIEDIKR